MSNSTIDALTDSLSHFLDVDVARYKLISTNLANIDTPGYHTRDLNFQAEIERAATGNSGMEGGQLLSASFSPVVHQVRGLMERPDGNNVSIERESLLLADAQMKYNLGVQLLKDEFHTISLAISSGGATS
ncbi:MAG: flagellar basal body rod protein FlgB [Candidatus Sulfotelmatobacter sp.]|jgi:flagellar basal-body rod protein FlgB